MTKATDSPRWCETCHAWGDHHTDRHPIVVCMGCGREGTHRVCDECFERDFPSHSVPADDDLDPSASDEQAAP